MSLVISAADDYVIRYTGLPASTGTFTICGHAKRTTDRNAYSWLMYLVRYTATATDLGFRTDSDGDALQGFANYGTQTSTVGTISSSDWFFWAITGNGTTLTVYYQPDGGAWATPQTLTQTTFVPERLIIGDTQGSTPFVGEFAQVRVWDSVLSAANLQAERESPTPIITSNLLSNHPFNSATEATALTDTTTNGYNFTVNGGATFTTSQPPQSGTTESNPILTGSLTLPQGQQSSALTPPTGLAVGAVNSYSVALSWTAVSGATGYEAFMSTSSGGTKVPAGATDSATTSLVVSAIPAGSTRYFTVRATKTGAPASGYSSEVTATTKRVYARIYATPSAAGVSGVSAIAWRAPSVASNIVGDVIGRGTVTWGPSAMVPALGETACTATFEVSQPDGAASGVPSNPLVDGESIRYYAVKGTANTGFIGTGVIVEQ
jgi:hypothetical protein